METLYKHLKTTDEMILFWFEMMLSEILSQRAFWKYQAKLFIDT